MKTANRPYSDHEGGYCGLEEIETQELVTRYREVCSELQWVQNIETEAELRAEASAIRRECEDRDLPVAQPRTVKAFVKGPSSACGQPSSGEALAAAADFIEQWTSGRSLLDLEQWINLESAERLRDKDTPLPSKEELEHALTETIKILRREASIR